MNFVLISPVGADVDPMPKTRPDQNDRDECLNTDTVARRPPAAAAAAAAASSRNPFRTDYDIALSFFFLFNGKTFPPFENTHTVLWLLCWGILFLSLFFFFV